MGQNFSNLPKFLDRLEFSKKLLKTFMGIYNDFLISTNGFKIFYPFSRIFKIRNFTVFRFCQTLMAYISATADPIFNFKTILKILTNSPFLGLYNFLVRWAERVVPKSRNLSRLSKYPVPVTRTYHGLVMSIQSYNIHYTCLCIRSTYMTVIAVHVHDTYSI